MVAKLKDNTPWIGVDLDRTMFEYHRNPNGYDPLHIGEPLWPMIARVKNWVKEGRKVKIYTARVSGFDLDTDEGKTELEAVVGAIHKKLESVGLPPLECTCIKDYACTEIWDDIAVTMQPNTGCPAIVR